MREEGSNRDPALFPGEGPKPPFLSPRGFLLLLVLILGVGTALRLLFAPGLCEADDFGYWGIADSWSKETLNLFENTTYYAHRVGLWFPAALGMSILGRGPLAVAAWPLACSLLLFFLLAAEGRRRFGSRSPLTLLALLLLALNPLEITLAGRLLPDGPFGSFTFAAIMLHWSALEGKGTRAALLWTGAGICAYAAYLIRSPGLLLLLAGALDLLLRRRFPRTALAAPAAFLLCQGAASWLYWKATGDPLFRQHLLLAQYAKETPGPFLGMTFLTFRPGSLLFGTAVLFLLALVRSFRRPDRRLRGILTFIAFWYLFHEFGSMSLGEYRPLVKDLRFFTVLSAPAALFIAGEGGFLLPGRTPGKYKWMGPALVLVLLAAFTAHGLNRVLRKKRGLESAVAKYTFVGTRLNESTPPKPVYVVHWRWELRLRYFSPDVRTFRILPPAEEWKGLDRGTAVLDWNFDEAGWKNPAWPPPPPAWRPWFTFKRKRKQVDVYRVGG